jgi:glycerol-3-phosphate cytidylyltransferase
MRRSPCRRRSSAAGSGVIIEIGAARVVVIESILPSPPLSSRMSGMPRTVITFGTFDVFHVGHLRVIERAASLGERLVVGVSADALNLRKKGREPVFSQGERLEIVAALRMVDEVFVEESLELKRAYIEQYAADVLVMGDDWRGKFDEFADICEVVYLTRTPAISTTALIEKISGSG